MSPRHTVLPWDSKTEPQYTLSYKVPFLERDFFANPCFQVSGGGRVYSYSLHPDNLATVDSDGKVRSFCISSVKSLFTRKLIRTNLILYLAMKVVYRVQLLVLFSWPDYLQ